MKKTHRICFTWCWKQPSSPLRLCFAPLLSFKVSKTPLKHLFLKVLCWRLAAFSLIYCDATDIFFGSPTSHIERPFLDDWALKQFSLLRRLFGSSHFPSRRRDPNNRDWLPKSQRCSCFSRCCVLFSPLLLHHSFFTTTHSCDALTPNGWLLLLVFNCNRYTGNENVLQNFELRCPGGEKSSPSPSSRSVPLEFVCLSPHRVCFDPHPLRPEGLFAAAVQWCVVMLWVG